MKVIIATDDRKTLNGHFALSQTFMFYNISDQNSELMHEVNFIDQNSDATANKYVQKKPFCLDERLSSIKGYDLLFVSAIGGPIVDRVMESGVYPMEVNAPESIENVLFKLQGLLKGDQPIWLRRILDKNKE